MGKGKGKGKGGRGGGKMYVANIEELQMRNAQVEEAKVKRKNRRGESDDEEEGDVDDDGVVFETTSEDLRELANFERASRLQKAGGNEDEEEVEDERPKGLLSGFQTANTNRGSKNPKQMKTKDMLKSMENDNNVAPELSRKEREALEAERKKAEYERRHAAGETEEAKADLARLAEVRKRREEARIKREKEEARRKRIEEGLPVDSDEEESDEDEKDDGTKRPKPSADKKATNAKKKAAAMEESTSGDIPVLTSIEIKKLKPDMLKEHLKKRGLSTQGQKKELMTRLTEHEKSRS